MNFLTVLICAAIGAFFWGITGFFIGLVIGILVWAGSANDKENAKPVSPKATTAALTGTEHTLSPPKSVPPEAATPQKLAGPSADQLREYSSCVAHLYATVLSFYPNSDSSKVNDVTELLKSDDWVKDKFVAIDELAGRLPQVQSERRDSPMLFQLHSNSHIERILRLPKPMKARLAMQLDGLLSGFGDADPKGCIDLIEKVRQALRQDYPTSNERLAAEDFIMRSGDQKAISTLQEMRRNPSRYKEMLRSGASGNTVLKTALGVFAGMLAADAVRAAVTNFQTNDLLTQLDHDITKAGGMDNVPLQDTELDSLASVDSSNATMSNFSDDTNANNWDNETPDVSSEEVSDSIQADATGSNWDADTTPESDGVSAEEDVSDSIQEDTTDADSDADTESASEVDDADSSSDFAFDFDD